MPRIQQFVLMSLFFATASAFGCVDNWLEQLRPYVIQEQEADGSHDLGHMERVCLLARSFACQAGADELVAATAALLHDIVMLPKNHPERDKASELAAQRADEILRELAYPEHLIPQVHHAIAAHSFSAGLETKTVEAMCVQDADRMEAIGAMGWLRCFYVSGLMGSRILDQEDPAGESRDLDDRRYALDHFVVKLLTLPATMKTEAGKILAAKLATFLDDYRTELIATIESNPLSYHWDDLYLCAAVAHEHGAGSLPLFHEDDPFAESGRPLEARYLVDIFVERADDSIFAQRLLQQLRFELSGYQLSPGAES